MYIFDLKKLRKILIPGFFYVIYIRKMTLLLERTVFQMNCECIILMRSDCGKCRNSTSFKKHSQFSEGLYQTGLQKDWSLARLVLGQTDPCLGWFLSQKGSLARLFRSQIDLRLDKSTARKGLQLDRFLARQILGWSVSLVRLEDWSWKPDWNVDTVIKLGKRDFKDLGWLDEYSEDQSCSVSYGQLTNPTYIQQRTRRQCSCL